MSLSEVVPQPERRELTCSARDRCGGCPHIGEAREAQRRHKREVLWKLLQAAGFDTRRLDVAVPEVEQWCWAPAPDGYRNRIRLRLDAGVPRFFNPNKSAECAVLESSLRQWLVAFEHWSRAHRRELGQLAHAELRARDLDGKWGLVLTPDPARGVAGEQLCAQLQRSLPNDVLLWIRGFGTPPAQRIGLAAGVFTYVPLGSFCQVNTAVNRALVSKVVECVLQRGQRHFVDAFCGAGNFSLPLLSSGCEGVGVECDEAAIAGLLRAAREQRVDAAGFRAESTIEAARYWRDQGLHPDVVIVDPPRAGAKLALDALLDLGPETLLLVSCNARSFIDDLKRARVRGMELERLWLGDMFPHTDHVELLATLERRA